MFWGGLGCFNGPLTRIWVTRAVSEGDVVVVGPLAKVSLRYV